MSPLERLHDIEAQIATLSSQQSELERLERRRAQLEHDRDVAQRALAGARRTLDETEQNADELDQLTFSRLIHWAAQDRDTEMQDRRRQRAAAAAKHEELGARLVALDREITTTRERIADLEGHVRTLDELIADKAVLLREIDDPRVARIDEVDRRLNTASAQRREIDEALHAAAGASSALGSVLSSLRSAHGWGTYDTWFGGGLISSAIKHDRLDEANDAARDVADKLAGLRRELADVGSDVAPTVDVSQFLRFTDVWFDNFFSDIAVQQRITAAQHQAETMLTAVEGTRRALTDAVQQLDRELATIADERKAILVAPAPTAG